MIDPEGLPRQSEPDDDPPSYAPRGDFLIGLAQEALDATRRRRVEEEIAVIKSALQGYANKTSSRRIQPLVDRLDDLKNQLKRKT